VITENAIAFASQYKAEKRNKMRAVSLHFVPRYYIVLNAKELQQRTL